MRDGFLLDPEIAHFNHGSYGACPAEVFAEYQRLQRELEAAPTDFFVRRLEGLLREARGALAASSAPGRTTSSSRRTPPRH